MKNRGIDIAREIAEQSAQDWKFGAVSQPCIAQMLPEVREMYLPKGEVQFGKEDFMDCATRAPLNMLETKLNYLLNNKLLSANIESFLRDNGYVTANGIELSDRFVAMGSGTTRYGNSLKAPLDFIHRNGVIPKSKLPKQDWMTFDNYHNSNDVTSDMFVLGQKFLNLITINYEQVAEDQFLHVEDMVSVAIHGWETPINGEYKRTTGDLNHAVMQIRPEYYIFDNYEEAPSDFIKKLSPDYIFFNYGYRLILSLTPPPKEWWILEILKNMAIALGLMSKRLEEIKKQEVKPLPIAPIAPNIPVEVAPKVSEYKWNTLTEARRSVRVICDEEKLSVNDKNELCATVGAESGWNPRAMGKPNKDGSRDYGIIQLNDKYWISKIKLFPSIEYVLDNPEVCIRWMCQNWQKNKKWWYGYVNGGYLKFL